MAVTLFNTLDKLWSEFARAEQLKDPEEKELAIERATILAFRLGYKPEVLNALRKAVQSEISKTLIE